MGAAIMGRYVIEEDEQPKASASKRYVIEDIEPAKQRQWSDVPLEALGNIPKSAGEFAGGIYQAVTSPIETGKNLLRLGAGAVRNTIPEAYQSQRPEAVAASQTANAVGQFYKDRYGSMEGFKGTLATDPVGALADVSAVFGGGAMLAPKASKAASVMRKASTVTNPVSITSKAIGKAAPYVGGKVADVIGGLGTHTGGESLRQAARSGMQGGKSAKTFTQNMRGQVPMTDVLETAKSNLADMGRAKSAEYRAGMAQVSGDKTVLDFKGIDDAIRNAAQNVTFKGQVKNQKAAEVLQKIADDVNQWKGLNPAEYHTPEGLDALKQRVGAMVESIPFEEKTARMVGNNIYHSIKGEITKQAPVYSDVMKGYSEATDQIKEIERALSLGGKASVDTAMRKLQSLTRNNVNTNYGNRAGLSRQLEAQGGREIMPALAGQALNTWTPRGLGGAVAGGLGLGGYAVGGAPLAVPMMAAQSPRLMGEAALKAGQAARLVKQGANAPAKLTGGLLDPATLANILYQAGRLPQQ
jgi:hypothetical protein